MRLIFVAAFPFVLGLLVRPPQLDAVAMGAALALIGALWERYAGWELPGREDR
jgi:hypothetical protein